jgi:predicted restriction endonuclease
MVYRKSDLPKACVVCGYNTHHEVCHIKPINGFLPSEFVADVNMLSNLVALCPNHHWKFDHGILTADFVMAAMRATVATVAQNKRLLSE